MGLSRAAKSLFQRYYGYWPKSKRYAGETITAQPKALVYFVAVSPTATSGQPITTSGWKCGPLKSE